MDFSFELEDALITGNINPEAMMGMGTVFGAVFGGLAMIRVTLYVAIIVLMIISRWRVFKKAGLPGRGVLIPVYNRVLTFKLGGMSGRRTLSILFPPLFLIAMMVNYFKIAEKFGKHRAFGLGILFVKIVFIPILAFDDSKRSAKKTIAKTAPVQKIVTKKPVKNIVKKKAPVKKKVTTKEPTKEVIKKKK